MVTLVEAGSGTTGRVGLCEVSDGGVTVGYRGDCWVSEGERSAIAGESGISGRSMKSTGGNFPFSVIPESDFTTGGLARLGLMVNGGRVCEVLVEAPSLLRDICLFNDRFARGRLALMINAPHACFSNTSNLARRSRTSVTC